MPKYGPMVAMTWMELKKFVESIPEDRMNDPILFFDENAETVCAVNGAEFLDEDQLDTEDGWCPRSAYDVGEWGPINKVVATRGQPTMFGNVTVKIEESAERPALRLVRTETLEEPS